jgi:hypothetical protein
MSTTESSFAFPDAAAIPQTTPRPERQRLVAKGQMLAEHCLDGGGTACVIGFVEYCLGKSPPHLDVIADLWMHLCREQDQLTRTQDPQRYTLLQGLLADVTARLQTTLTSVNERKPV